MSKYLITAGLIITGIIFGYLHDLVVIPHPQDKFVKIMKLVDLDGKSAKLELDLPPDTYLLKIKHVIKPDMIKKVMINGKPVSVNTLHFIRRGGIIETDYIHLQRQLIKAGKNLLEINFLKNEPSDIDVRLTNYRLSIGNDIYVLFSDSALIPLVKLSYKSAAFNGLLITLILIGIMYFLRKIIYLKTQDIFIYQLYCLIPFLIFLLSLVVAANINSGYKVFITPVYFWTFGLVSFFISNCIIVIMKILQGFGLQNIKSINSKIIKKRNYPVEVIMFLEHTFHSISFSDKCIMLFAPLLVISGILITLHLDPVADILSVIAFIFLITGILAKLIILFREKR